WYRNNKNGSTAPGSLNNGDFVTFQTSGTFTTSTAGGNPLSIPDNLKSLFSGHKGTVIFYLRIQDPVDGKWYWVNAKNGFATADPNPNAKNPDNIFTSNSAAAIPFTRGCNPPPGHPPFGYVWGA